MECNKCGYRNEPDAKFCRNCGNKLDMTKELTTKDEVKFVPDTSRRKEEDFLCFGESESGSSGFIVGAIFIIIGLFIGIVLFAPLFVGEFFGNFGEWAGTLGSDIGNFFGSWGENFGEAVGNFFENIFTDVQWWNILQLIVPSIFILLGIVILISAYRKR
jgi:hypothetical protein